MSNSVKLSIIVPACNEERLVAATVRTCREAADALCVPYEIVVVDDGSVDRTGAIAAALEGVTLVTHARNQGLGGAVRSGLRAARGEVCIVAPADNPHSTTVLRRFMEASESADLVLGFRPHRLGYTPLMRFNTWLYHAVLRAFCGLRWRDVNWVHMYRRVLFVDLPVRARGVCAAAETVLLARARGYRIGEVECPMRARRHGVPSARRLSVMIRTLVGLVALVWRFRRAR